MELSHQSTKQLLLLVKCGVQLELTAKKELKGNMKLKNLLIIMQPERSKLTIGISSRALFNLNNSHEIFINEGVDAYKNYQIKNENKILEPGDGFSLVKKILNLNNIISHY